MCAAFLANPIRNGHVIFYIPPFHKILICTNRIVAGRHTLYSLYFTTKACEFFSESLEESRECSAAAAPPKRESDGSFSTEQRAPRHGGAM